MSDADKINSFLDAKPNACWTSWDRAAIAKARDILLDCHRRRGKIYTMGNGGSASTAQHFACDLAKYVIPAGQRPFDVHCLTDNFPLYTAWANDAAREDVFANLMRGLLTADDVVLAISVHGGSGFSADLVKGVLREGDPARKRSRWWVLTAAFCIANARARCWCRWNRRRKQRPFTWSSNTC